MMEDAAALSGRNGGKDEAQSEVDAIAHAQLVDGRGLAEEPNVLDELDASSAPRVGSTHTVAYRPLCQAIRL